MVINVSGGAGSEGGGGRKGSGERQTGTKWALRKLGKNGFVRLLRVFR